MKDVELVRIQPRTNPVSLMRSGDWLVVMDVSTGSRVHIHKNHIRDLMDAAFDIGFAIKREQADV